MRANRQKDPILSDRNFYASSTEKLELLPEENKIVMVIDPTKDYASSSDTNDTDDSDVENAQVQLTAKNQLTVVGLPQRQQSAAMVDMPEGFKNLFFCQYCDTAYVEHDDCLEHEANHDAINPHQCNFCSFSCASRNTIIAHIKECHEPEKPFICMQCNKKFGRRSDLKKHSIVHTGIRPFSCPVCGKNFSRNTNLTKHLRIHSGLKPHVCHKCPRSFTTKADLLRHTQVHSEIKPYQCSQCPATYSRRDKFLYHARTHLKKDQAVATSLSMTQTANTLLTEPSATIDTENIIISLDPYNDLSANTDAEEQSNPIQFKSPPPPPSAQPFQTQTHLLHIQSELAIQNFSTPSALKQISQVQPPEHAFVLPQHIQQITFPDHVTGDAVTFIANKPPKKDVIKPKNFICESCPKRFVTQSSLQNHKNIHLGIRNHICLTCDKCFARKRELDRHSVIHTGFKPFSCVHCDKKFGRKDKLVRHERIHMEEKMYPCTNCPMTFNRKDGLLLHMKLHNKEKEPPSLAMLTIAIPHASANMDAKMVVPPPPPTTLVVSSDILSQYGRNSDEMMEKPIDLSSGIVSKSIKEPWESNMPYTH